MQSAASSFGTRIARVSARSHSSASRRRRRASYLPLATYLNRPRLEEETRSIRQLGACHGTPLRWLVSLSPTLRRRATCRGAQSRSLLSLASSTCQMTAMKRRAAKVHGSTCCATRLQRAAWLRRELAVRECRCCGAFLIMTDPLSLYQSSRNPLPAASQDKHVQPELHGVSHQLWLLSLVRQQRQLPHLARATRWPIRTSSCCGRKAGGRLCCSNSHAPQLSLSQCVEVTLLQHDG